MKNRHNKKRNTAFVYEALIKEATAAILKRDHEQKEKVINVIAFLARILIVIVPCMRQKVYLKKIHVELLKQQHWIKE